MSDHDWEAAYSDGAVPTPLDEDVQRVAAGLKPGKALDLGCGVGQNSNWLAENGWEVRGVDIAPSAIAAAEESAVPGTRFELGDVTRWTPGEDRYDFVISTYALPGRGPGRTKALETAARSVAPGGTILITEFDESVGDSGWLNADDLVSLTELTGHLDGFEIIESDVRVSDHAHGHHEQKIPVAIVVARRGSVDV